MALTKRLKMENRARKKHLSTDPDARMVPRPEIIAIIAEELRNPKAEAQLTNSIKAAMKIFDEYDPLFSRQAKAAEIKSAEQLAGTVATLDQQLEKAPPALKHYLFTPLAGRRVPKAKEFSAPRRRFEKHFRRALKQMRRDCERIVAEDAKVEKVKVTGPEPDRAQRFCAELAYRLVKTFSERQVTGSAEGPYHRVASLLFELLTGRPEVDLKRACDSVRSEKLRQVQVTARTPPTCT